MILALYEKVDILFSILEELLNSPFNKQFYDKVKHVLSKYGLEVVDGKIVKSQRRVSAESDDERIRKRLLTNFSALGREWWGELKVKDILFWLEKQGKQEIKEKPIWKHWKDGIAGNGEGKQIFLIKSGDSYTLSSCLGYECDYIELSELDRLLEKQGEKRCIDDLTQQEAMDIAVAKCFEQGGQKPIWGDKDDSMFQSCIGAVATNDYYKGEEKEKIYDWLKSLKQRIGG